MICQVIALTINLVSYHSDPGYENFNPGVGANCALTENISAGTGVFRNSYGKASVYSAAAYTVSIGAGFRAGINAGLTTGYPRGTFLPMASFVLNSPTTISGWGAALAIVPVTKYNSGVAHFMLNKRI